MVFFSVGPVTMCSVCVCEITSSTRRGAYGLTTNFGELPGALLVHLLSSDLDIVFNNYPQETSEY